MKSLQPLRIVLIAMALGLAALAAPAMAIPTLVRMAVLLAVAVGAMLVSLRQPPGDNWLRYTRALIVVVFVYLAGVMSPAEPSLRIAVLVLLAGAMAAGGAAELAMAFAGATKEGDEGAELQKADLWILNLGVFCAVAWAIAGIVAGAGVAVAGLRFLAALGYVGLFFLVSGGVRSRSTIAVWSALAIVALVAVLGIGAMRVWHARQVIEHGRRDIVAGNPKAALVAAEKAHRMNQTLQWDGLRLRYVRLQRDAWVALGHYREALQTTGLAIRLWYEPRVLTGDDEQQLEFLKRYVSDAPLQPLVDEYASLEQMNRFLRLHAELREIPDEVELLHLMFLHDGRVDRLAERYASAGLPPMRHSGSFIEALETIAKDAGDDKGRATQARYLLGVVRFQSRRLAEAREDFEAVLKEWPDDQNTLTFLERLAEARRDETELARLEALPHRVVPGRMTGKKNGFNVDDTLWTALETRAGQYAFAADFGGRREQGVWPRVSVFIGDGAAPAFSEEVQATDWRTYGFERGFKQAGRSRLLIVFENDLYVDRGPDRDALNRNLYFRSMRVTRR